MITDDSSQVNVPEDLEAIRTATKQWYQAWQSREIGEYIDKYQRDFKYRGRKDIDAYKAYKDRVFDSYENMTIQFSNLRVFSHAKYAVAIMNQNFQGDDRYSSQGRKILYWTKSDDSWKIAHEVFLKSYDLSRSLTHASFLQSYPKTPPRPSILAARNRICNSSTMQNIPLH